MAFQKLLAFTKKVADFADKPSGTPAEIKAQFDAAPDEVRQSLNSLIDALKSTTKGDSGAKNIGVTSISGITGSDIQTVLEALMPTSGSNANGTFVKFPDGTLICYQTNTIISSNTDFYTRDWAFPANFVGNVAVTISAYNNYMGVIPSNAAKTYCTPNGQAWRVGVQFGASVPSGYNVNVTVTAIGRWK